MANAVATSMKDVISKVMVVVAAATWKQDDIGIFGPWFGVCLNAAVSGGNLSIDIEAGKEIDLVSTVAVAATVGAAVYYNPTTGAFAASSATGNALVGYTTIVKNTDNVFRIEKVRYATVA